MQVQRDPKKLLTKKETETQGGRSEREWAWHEITLSYLILKIVLVLVTVRLSGLTRYQANYIGVGWKPTSTAHAHAETNSRTNPHRNDFSKFRTLYELDMPMWYDIFLYTIQGFPKNNVINTFTASHHLFSPKQSQIFISDKKAWGNSEAVLLLLISFLHQPMKDFWRRV